MSKLILMGTNDFVVPVFDSLKTKHEILAVYTRAPKPVGRKHILTQSPVHVWADENKIPVHTSINEYENIGADYIVVISYGVMLRDNVLNSAHCINIHPGSLPKYRGPSPIRTAIFNGDDNLDVCLINMTAEMDAGDVLMCKNIKIGENDTNEIVEHNVSLAAINILNKFFESPNDFTGVPQTGTPGFTRKFTGDDEIIDWNKNTHQIHNQIRALGAGRTKINGIDVKILETRVNNGVLDIVRLQPAGKNPMDWKSFVNGLHGAEIIIGK